jgi:hypothetical protein
MPLNPKTLTNIVEHASSTALQHLGVNVHVDDPAVKIEEIIGTDGKTDVFVFDVQPDSTNIDLLKNFDPSEDFLLFKNVNGSDLTVGDLGEGLGFNVVLFSGSGSSNFLVFGAPYEQDSVQSMILPFEGRLVFDDPFLI